MAHEYFNNFRDWFEDELQTLIEYDSQDTTLYQNKATQKVQGLNHQVS